MNTDRNLEILKDWTPFLLEKSGLPGPRGNLELAQVVAEEGAKLQFETISLSHRKAEENTPEVFLVFCGVIGLANWPRAATMSCLPGCGRTPPIPLANSRERGHRPAVRWR